ncbi:MAG: histone H1 [Pseudomonadota bacterium]
MTDKPKRPRDANQLAHMIAGIATGDVTDEQKAKGQVKGGKIGGRSRAAALTPEQRSEIARAAAQARWKKGD